MEARLASVLALVLSPALMGAAYQTENFVINAPTAEIAQQVGQAAEVYRRELAIEWLGHELPRWAAPCPVKVKVGQLGAGGATTFSFFPNGKGSAEVCNWDMNIQGSLERILDSVLPHEVSHTIFACHFRRPLPRWADEGAATLAEHDSEKRRQVLTVRQTINTKRRIPLRNLFNIKEYPTDMQDVMTLYAEGYSLAELLVQEGGRTRYLKFLSDAHREGWDKAVHAHYGYRNVDDLEKRWTEWVIAGSPELELPKGQLLVDAGQPRPADRPVERPGTVIRGQSPVEDPFLESHTPSKLAAPAPRTKNSAMTAKPAAEELTARPPRRRKPPVAVTTEPAAAATDDDDDFIVAEDVIPRSDAEPVPVDPKAAQEFPGNKRREIHNAEARTSANQRQVTEWSEFPQDHRPNPMTLPSRNRSGARP